MKKMLKNAEYSVMVIAICLTILGIFGIYSAGYNTLDTTEYQKQILWACVGLVTMVITWCINVDIYKPIAYVAFSFCIILLIGVLFTTPINNATSWYNIGGFNFQPSEITKIVYILALATFIDRITKKDKNAINKWYNILIILALFFVPFILILMQPDLGTAIVFLVITFFMLFRAGLSYKYILAIFLCILITLPLAYFFVLSPYQQNRIKVFLNPDSDPLNTGYNAIQSRIAIGGGKLLGMGFLNGTQSQFGYLPVKSSDFIYSLLSEEFGFICSVLIVIAYCIMIIRIFHVAKTASNNFSSYIATGIAAMFFFHMVENIGMTMGLLPITGIPLLFVSYGGTSMITSFISLGIILSISSRRKKALFVD